MSLPIPIVGVEAGPDYAQDVNNSLTILDQHSHLLGSGVQITPGAININSALTINNQSLTNIGAATFFPQLATAANNSLYLKGVDFYLVDGNGNDIRVTQSGNVAGSSGTITGLPSGTASASFSAGTFTFQAASLTGANIDGASYILRNNTASSFGLTLSPPNAMSSNYTLVLPTLPASTLPIVVDTSGNMAASHVTVAQLAVAVAQALTPIGSVLAFAGAASLIPAGFLYCDGSAISRTTYNDLLNTIGTRWGTGDGSTTFNIPDFRGFFLRGFSDGTGRDPDAASRTAQGPGGVAGDQVGSIELSAFASHLHAASSSVSDPGHNHQFVGVGSNQANVGSGTATGSLPGSFTNTAVTNISVSTTTSNTGGSTETRPINANICYMIKAT